MNKKLLITIILVAVLFISGLLGFVIIPKILGRFKPDGFIPQITAVSGNGSNAVIVDDSPSGDNYLFYIGNFVPSTSIEYKQNEYNKVEYGAIYRVKLANGLPVYNSTKYDERLYGDEQKIWTENVKLIVPKIAGFEKSALWIFDKYIIYTSPNNTKNKYDQLQNNKLDFFRADLDGGNHKKIYTMQTADVPKTDFTVVSSDGKIFLLCKDGDKLLRVSVSETIGKTEVITERTDSFAFPIVTSYDEDLMTLKRSYAGNMQYVYYTETREEGDLFTGSILKRYTIASGENIELRRENGSTFNTHKVVSLSNGTLVFGISTASDTVTPQKLYAVGNKRVSGDTYVEEVDKDGFKLANLNMYYTALDIYQSDEKFFFQSEQSTDFQFISLRGNSIYSYKRNDKPNGNNFSASPSPLASDAESIIEVNSSNIVYKSTDNSIRFINFDGEVSASFVLQNPVAEFTSYSTFYNSLNNQGHMVFFIKTLNELAEGTTGNTTVAAFVDKQGNEYLLCQLKETYLQKIEQD